MSYPSPVFECYFFDVFDINVLLFFVVIAVAVIKGLGQALGLGLGLRLGPRHGEGRATVRQTVSGCHTCIQNTIYGIPHVYLVFSVCIALGNKATGNSFYNLYLVGDLFSKVDSRY